MAPSYERVPVADDPARNGDSDTEVAVAPALAKLGLSDHFTKPHPNWTRPAARAQRCSPCGIARVLGSLMVCVVFLLLFVSYVPFVAHFADGSAKGNVLILTLNVLVALVVTSYLQTVLTDPGSVPPEWSALVSRMRNPPYKKCWRSGLYRPPRSHFCGVTRRVVLNMDHFCPWVNNCVGFYNRKFFILFTFYTALAAILVAVSLGGAMREGGFGVRMSARGGVPRIGLTHSSSSGSDAGPAAHAHAPFVRAGEEGVGPSGMSDGAARTPTWVQSALEEHFGDMTLQIMGLMGVIVDSVFAITLVFFSAAHVWMAARNQTTIEGTAASARFRLASRWRNLQTVFGEDARLWLLPVFGRGPLGDGVVWECADGDFDGLTLVDVDDDDDDDGGDGDETGRGENAGRRRGPVLEMAPPAVTPLQHKLD